MSALGRMYDQIVIDRVEQVLSVIKGRTGMDSEIIYTVWAKDDCFHLRTSDIEILLEIAKKAAS